MAVENRSRILTSKKCLNQNVFQLLEIVISHQLVTEMQALNWCCYMFILGRNPHVEHIYRQ
jgi:hypothetical protein